jgi:hypothetical protein
VALIGALVAGGESSAPARLGPRTYAAMGFSDESPATFSNAYFRRLQTRLGITQARLIAPFDGVTRAGPWLAAVHAAGLSPYVTLGGDFNCNNPVGATSVFGACPPPTDAVYTAGFTAMVRAYPAVRDWGAWNEPSNYVYYPCATPAGSPAPARHACREARLGAAQAAGYWLDASRADRALGRSDVIVAGETGADCVAPAFNLCTADGRLWTGYVPAYLAALGGARPAVWGTHSYHDIQERLPLAGTDTNRFISFMNAVAGAPTVWLTEEGAWLGGLYGSSLNGSAAAQRSAAHAFLELPRVPSARRRQIAREYYYQLQSRGGPGFDAGLLDVSGAPRPAYCVLTREAPSRCTGNPTQPAAPHGTQY